LSGRQSIKKKVALPDRMVPRRNAATAPRFCPNFAFPGRQSRSRRRSHHYCSLTHYEQTARNGAMAAPGVLDFIRQKYRSQNQSRVPTVRCRDSGPYFFPKRTLRARSKRQTSRAPALRAFLGGRSIIVTQPRRPVLGNHARNASRNSPITGAQGGVGTRAARHGERCGIRSKARQLYAGRE
jgi:hypothetical protein